jgi:3-deoxy-D-manno-octulosonate 8-phosphate phosphatase (KDO 8-P phosphatase)
VTVETDFSRIKAIALDVDGVLTDGGFWWGPNGEEWKRFCFADVMGISLGKKAGLTFALISGEASPLVDRFAAKMGIADVFKGCKDKAAALQEFAARHSLSLADIAFMGDDVNDLGAIKIAGLSAAPANAMPDVARTVAFRATARGGDGAVRELVDAVLSVAVRLDQRTQPDRPRERV